GAFHRPAAAARLVETAQLRARRGALRLLPAAVPHAEMAGSHAIHGGGGRPLVADLRRAVLRLGGQAGARHAPDRSGVAARESRARAGGGRPDEFRTEPQVLNAMRPGAAGLLKARGTCTRATAVAGSRRRSHRVAA